jgi:CRISPR-associated protein Csd1
MSWIQKLYETYEACTGNRDIPDSGELFPIAHTTQQAHIEIVIDDVGKFKSSKVIENKDERKTLIPCTEESAGRAGKKPKNHPLCDKLQYIAGDFARFGGEVTSGFSGNSSEPYNNYISSLSAWCDSPFKHEMAFSILSYVRKGTLVKDLVDVGIFKVEVDASGIEKVLLEWRGEKINEPSIFKVLPPGQNPMDAFVRFRVESKNQLESCTWGSSSLIQSWIDYYADQQKIFGICSVIGHNQALAEQHPAKLRHDADKAKLISSNDTSGFTFKGRFIDASQVVGVSFEATQKAHNALRWLIRRKQAFRSDTQVFISWAVKGKEIPDPWSSSLDFLGDRGDSSETSSSSIGDVGQSFALRLNKRIAGYKASISDTEDIVIMGIDSATPGRMAITFYRELNGSEFLKRIELWHHDFAWFQNYGKELHFVGAPAPKDIAKVAFGNKVEGKNGIKLLNATVERILPCVLDGSTFPKDLIKSTVQRTSNRNGIEPWEWEKCLGIACSLYKGTNKERNYKMTLEENRKTRDYLYGCLLAVAERIESTALFYAKEKRDTTASRLMQRFADHPFSTWRTIETALTPYMARISARTPGLLAGYKELLDEIHAKFADGKFSDDNRLSGEYLLGYHCQRKWLREHKRMKSQWVLKEPTESEIQEIEIEE